LREDVNDGRQDTIVARRRRHDDDDDDDDPGMTSQRGQSSPEAEVTASSVGQSVGAVLAHPVNWRLSLAVSSCSGGKMADRAERLSTTRTDRRVKNIWLTLAFKGARLLPREQQRQQQQQQ